jgi:uncharacterized protein (DUF1015 family)
MSDIQTFRGLRYSLGQDTDLDELLCPPYDIIPPDLQTQLYQRSPYNAVRLELGMELPTDSTKDNRYTRAARLLEEWLSQGTLLTEEEAAFYLLQEEFSHRGRSMTRCSILAAVRLEEFSRGVILPHEETSQGPKRDRMELLAATRANLSPILSIYRDSSGRVRELLERVSAGPPLAHADYDDTHIKLWAITDKAATQTVTESLKDAPVYLADGHHRYETALQYRNIQKADGNQSDDAGHNFVMMSLIEIQDPGLLVLPYHRAIRGLSRGEMERMMTLINESFNIQTLDVRLDGTEAAISHLEELLERATENQVALGLLETHEGKVSLLTLRNPPGASSPPLKRCATQVLGKSILEPVLETQQQAVERGALHFTHDSKEVRHLLMEGDYQLGFLLPPLSLDLFEEVVLSGERMPLKSTYFSPKLPTGLVINRLV